MFFLLIRRVDWWLHLDWCHFPHNGEAAKSRPRKKSWLYNSPSAMSLLYSLMAGRQASGQEYQYIVSKFRFRPNIARELVKTVRFVGSCLPSYLEIIVDLQKSGCVHIFFQSMTICQVAICCHFDRKTALNLRL